ncbi:MAG: AAA family ATPase [Lachnospiraceae bacterium]|nr:AAA family ATPase [Lachnospiraceae bacterium]
MIYRAYRLELNKNNEMNKKTSSPLDDLFCGIEDCLPEDPRCTGSSRRSHRSGNDLFSRYTDGNLESINDDMYKDFVKHENFICSVTERSESDIEVLSAMKVAYRDSGEPEKLIMEKFRDCRIASSRDITCEEFRNALENRGVVSNGRAILGKLGIAYRAGFFDPYPFDLDENVLAFCKTSKALCRKRAQEILGSKNLFEEIDRIYSRDNLKEYVGHPVHYLISAGDFRAAMDMEELLAKALFSNGRLPSCRQMVMTNIARNAYRDDRFKQVLEAAEGGIMVIVLDQKVDIGRYATDFHDVTKCIGEMVEKLKKDTLFVFVEIMGKSLRNDDALANITSKADIIQITEGSGDRACAEKYLLELTSKVDFAVDDAREALDHLPGAESYTVTDIFSAFNSWYGSGLKNHVYKAYKNKKKLEIKITKPEDKPYDELQKLIGLTEAKRVVSDIIAAGKMMKAREQMGLNTEANSLHMLFSGNPGSAKTTVARLIAQILKEEDIVKSGAFVECGRQDLVGKYVGWTAKIVEDKFKAANGGVLFIDEAYSLVEDGRTYGAEAINVITQLMENYRDSVIVIFAGYVDKMKEFLDQNEGLKSRISFHLDFPDYTSDELTDILKLMCEKREYVLDDDALACCHDIFDSAVREENYGNGRYVRNLLEQAIIRQSSRVLEESAGKKLSKEEICILKKEDFKELKCIETRSSGSMGFTA